MLASLHREAQAQVESSSDGGHQGSNLEKHVYGDDSSSSEEDTTSFSTWKSPVRRFLFQLTLHTLSHYKSHSFFHSNTGFGLHSARIANFSGSSTTLG